MARFGFEVFRPSPRQSDLLIVAGTVNKKIAPVVTRLYEQIPAPRFVMPPAAGGIFLSRNGAAVSGMKKASRPPPLENPPPHFSCIREGSPEKDSSALFRVRLLA